VRLLLVALQGRGRPGACRLSGGLGRDGLLSVFAWMKDLDWTGMVARLHVWSRILFDLRGVTWKGGLDKRVSLLSKCLSGFQSWE
jgi:hypothetical protein